MIINKLQNIFAFIKSIIVFNYYTFKYRNTDFFNYKKLSNPKFICPKFFNSVYLYGNYKAVANLRNKKFNFITEYLEHGICYDEDPNYTECLGYINRPLIKTVYTYGENRKRVIEEYLRIKKLTRNVIPVGPYIKGSKNFLPKISFQKLKQQLGKTLVVFPSHSDDYTKSDFDANTLLQEIGRIKNDFNSVLICIYWLDIVEKKHELYEKAGYTIITAGHRSDPNFLPRLKDIIELSDLTMSNVVGTLIGYSICLNRPHYFFSQKLTYNVKESRHTKEGKKNIDSTDIHQLFAQNFGELSFEITNSQIHIIEEYWGKWAK